MRRPIRIILQAALAIAVLLAIAIVSFGSPVAAHGQGFDSTEPPTTAAPTIDTTEEAPVLDTLTPQPAEADPFGTQSSDSTPYLIESGALPLTEASSVTELAPDETQPVVGTMEAESASTALPSAEMPVPSPSETRVPEVRVLVKRSEDTIVDPSSTDLAEAGGTIEESALEQLGYYVVLVPADQLDAVLLALGQSPDVASAEIDGTVTIAGLTVNDPYYGQQTALELIGAEDAWETTTGSAGVVIAFLDTGLDLTNQEFAGRILPGYDFVNSDTDPSDDSFSGHGTLVTGIAVAAGNNGAGIAGVNWTAQILPIKVLDQFGNGSYSDVAAGIVWAVDNGADVINLSLGGSTTPGPALQAAIDYADANGVVVVAAAGNSYTSLFYPAQYSTVIAVGAVDGDLERLSSSNFGPGLDVVAPGEGLVSTLPGGGYALISGTSASAPQVAALAALIVSQMESANPQEVSDIISLTALDLGAPGQDDYYGAGLIQMDAAILVLAPAKPPSASETEEPDEEGGSNNNESEPTPASATDFVSQSSDPPITETPDLMPVSTIAVTSTLPAPTKQHTPTAAVSSASTALPVTNDDLTESETTTKGSTMNQLGLLLATGGFLWFISWLVKRFQQ